jgi:L-fuculose-phosphate aldolase
MRKQAACVLIPYHGVILAGKDFLLVLDALERINTNAYCLLSRKMLE